MIIDYSPSRFLVLLASGLLVFGLSLSGAQRSPNENDIAYVIDCGGHYLRIDADRARSLGAGTVAGVPEDNDAYDGCLVDSMQVDPVSGVAYAVVPKTASVDDEGQRYYKVVALHSPTLKVLDSRDIPYALDEVPDLLLERPNYLLVSYGVPENITTAKSQRVVERLSSKDLRIQNDQASLSITSRLESMGGFSASAHFDRRGRIIDKSRVVDLAKPTIVNIDGYSLLSEAVSSTFQSLQRTGVNGKKYLDIVFADAADDLMLFVIGWDTESRQSPSGGGLLLYDTNREKIVSSIVTPFRAAPFDATLGTPTVHLTPDAKLAIVEQYEWRVSGPPTFPLAPMQERFKTGAVAVYDMHAGIYLRTIRLDPEPGYSGRVVGFSTHQRLMFYASAENLYVVNLDRGDSRALPLPEGFLPIAVLSGVK